MIEQISKVCSHPVWVAARYLLDKGKLSASDADTAHRLLMGRSGGGASSANLAASWYLAGEGFLALGPMYKLDAVHCHLIANDYLRKAQQQRTLISQPEGTTGQSEAKEERKG